MAVIPGWNVSGVLSANDLKPSTVRLFRYMSGVELTTKAEPK
jgi:hypothetical protein